MSYSRVGFCCWVVEGSWGGKGVGEGGLDVSGGCVVAAVVVAVVMVVF